MPRSTNTERIDSRSRDLSRIESLFGERMERLFGDTQQRKGETVKLRDRADQDGQRLATLEQRCAALETLSTRVWQVWLAIVGAGVAILIAILKK